MTTTTEAAALRAEFKRRGWTARQISVRSEYYSMGSSIDVTVKDPAIPLHLVEALAEGKEHVRRDEATGEILSGGNRYVHVRYSSEACAAKGRQYVEQVQQAADRLSRTWDGSGTLEPIGMTGFHVGRTQCNRLSLWGDGWICERNEPEGIAYELALAIDKRSGGGR